MRKRLVIILCFTMIIVVAVWFGSVPEPRYNGVRLGALLDNNPVGPGSGLFDLQKAAKALGPQAVPYLTAVLKREPTSFQQWYARTLPRLPLTIRKLAPPPKIVTQRRARAAAALTQTGTNAITALPLLIKIAINDPFFGTRHNAVGTLAAVAPGTAFEEAAATAVISRTTDENQTLREHAFSSLGAFTNQMEKVVPTLLHGLRQSAVRENAMVGLRRLGTNAMPIVRRRVQNEAYLPMSFDALERELAHGP